MSDIERDTDRDSDRDRRAEDLVRRIGAGDTAAEGELVRRYRRGLLFQLTRHTGDPARAEDLVQETFRIVLERLRGRGIDQPDRLAGFLLRTGRNLRIADIRKRARRGEDVPAPEVERQSAPAGQLAGVLVAERARAVRRLLGELTTDRDRQVLSRFYLSEQSKEQICADLDLSSLHFNRVLYRARERFRQIILERSPGLARPAEPGLGDAPARKKVTHNVG